MVNPRATRPADAPAPPGQPEPVVEIGGFEVVSQLGAGGMGRVYKARQKSIDRLVALKVLTPALAANTDYAERFEREARAAGKLTHPNIVGVFDCGTQQGVGAPVRWIAFEFVDGGSLESRLKNHGRVSEREALKIVRDVAEALRYASEKGLIHRDVKPDNILLAADGTPKLADLGLAKFRNDDTSLTQTGIVMGTPHYMAPEQALGERDLDVRADIYALGLVLYRCLTGEVPFVADSALAILTRHINQDCPDPRALVPEISEGAVALLRGMTARDTKLRFLPDEVVQRATELLARSGAVSAARPVASPPPPAASPPASATNTTAATLVQPAPPRTPSTRASVGSAGKVATAAAPAPSAARRASGLVHTVATTGARPKTAPAKVEADPDAESRAPLFVVFGLCALLAGAGVWLVVKKAPKTVSLDDGTSAVASAGSDSKPQPAVPTPPVAPTPPPVRPTPEPPANAPDLPAETAARLSKRIHDASAALADAPDAALGVIAELKRDAPPTDPAGTAADGLATNVARVLKGFRTADAELVKYGMKELVELARRATKQPLERAVCAEAHAWAAGLHAIGDVSRRLQGQLLPLARVPFDVPEGSGAYDALADRWGHGVAHLELASGHFDRLDWKAAEREAHLASGALKDAPAFCRLQEDAVAIARMVAWLAEHPATTPLDAVNALRGREIARTCDLVVPTRAGQISFDAREPGAVPEFLLPNHEKVEPLGVPLTALRAGFRQREPGSAGGISLHDEPLIELRLWVTFDKEGTEAIVQHRFGGLTDKMKPSLTLIGAGSGRPRRVRGGVESYVDKEITDFKRNAAGGPGQRVEDFLWQPRGDEVEIRLVLDRKTDEAEVYRPRPPILIRGEGATITKVEWFTKAR